MAHVRRSSGWELPERLATPEPVFDSFSLDRRAFLGSLGLAGLSAGALLAGCSMPEPEPPEAGARLDPSPPGGASLYPAPRNPVFADAGRPLTEERIAATTTNFYEFTPDKTLVWKRVGDFHTRPWAVEVSGLCHEPRTFDLDDLARLAPLEERIYRHRCVEAWAMTVPWTGFPLRALLQKVEPTAEARFVRFASFFDRGQAPGQKAQTAWPWPYHEGLTLAEAMNDLTLLATGMYGHGLPKQHGAPLRLVVPWKYGYKSIKSVAKIELVAEQPPTFWSTLAPAEYGFIANIDPELPHPRWAQDMEWLIGEKRGVPTQKYNGYGPWVAYLYPRYTG
jgi:methionine sulfoxide reductase catalytic subunit